MPSEIAWERFWCPREGRLALDWSGFLKDPRGSDSKYTRNDSITFDTVDEAQCVILLGEPGMGKSYEMLRRYDVTPANDPTIFRNLRQYDTTQAAQDDIFDSSEFQVAISGNAGVTLALDSLDEALLEIHVLSSWLLAQLRRYPRNKMRLRIACRTGDWPLSIEEGLKGIWGDADVKAYEIAPLTKSDVHLAAVTKGVDPEGFLAEVEQRNAVPLAFKPNTLRFLLNAFASHRTLPATQAKLYELGLLQLCDESQERREAMHTGSLDAEQRLAVASRIAAATIFAHRAAIWRGRDPLEKPSADVSIRELVGGSEPVAQRTAVAVTETELQETLSTGLFSARGVNGMGWGHQTYAEFLAARWIVQHSTSLPQIESLILQGVGESHGLIPQLRETISWMASMHSGVRSLVLRTEPQLILEADPTSVTDHEREGAVRALLELAAQSALPYPDFLQPRQYKYLNHPRLAEQLAPYINDRSAPNSVRDLAIEIARAGSVSALQEDCAVIALDSSEPLEIRVEAARLIRAIGESSTRVLLLPLAIEPQAVDVYDDLKGVALGAVWPEHLTPAQLFGALTHPKRANFSGAYDFFLRDLADNLVPDMLRTGLAWARQTGPRFGMRSRLADAITRFAWDHLAEPDVFGPFVDLVTDRLSHYRDLVEDDEGGVFASALLASVEQRRRVVEELVDRLGNEVEEIGMSYTHRTSTLVTRDDVEWLIERAASFEIENPRGHAWARLLSTVANLTDPEDFQRLYDRRDRPHIRQVFSGYWEAIEIASAAANELRDQHAKRERFRQLQQSREDPASELPSGERVIAIIRLSDSPEAGQADRVRSEQWVKAARELTRSPDGKSFLLNHDLDQTPTWQLLNDQEKSLLVKEAADFVKDTAVSVAGWTADGKATLGVWAGDKALRLLANYGQSRLHDLQQDIWSHWIPVIVINKPTSSDDQAFATHCSLISAAYATAPDMLIAAVSELILAEDKQHGNFWSLRCFESVWDERFSEAILTLIKHTPLTVSTFKTLMGALLKQRLPAAQEYIDSLLAAPLPRTEPRYARLVATAAVLLEQKAGEALGQLQPLLRRSGKFRRAVALSFAHRATDLNDFTEDQLGYIFDWLTKEFPYPDPWYEGVYSPSAEDEVRRWRNDVIAALKNRSTLLAVRTLERLKKEYVELEWLSHTVLVAQENLRRTAWSPPQVSDLLALAARVDNRLVQTGDQLLDLLIESLDRYQAELLGELPAVSTLWDQINATKYRPKDENHLSDAVARHLKKRPQGSRDSYRQRGSNSAWRLRWAARTAYGHLHNGFTAAAQRIYGPDHCHY